MYRRALEQANVIVIRQPWAWLIVNGHKHIENRTWPTRHRGTLLIQGAATLPPKNELEHDPLFGRALKRTLDFFKIKPKAGVL